VSRGQAEAQIIAPVFGQRHKALEADLVRTFHGFDALLVLTGSTASANL
jgi:hypothetical protein